MKTIEELCKELKNLTWYNQHTEAKIVIAEYFKLNKYTKIFKAIEQIGDAEGCLPGDVSDYRYRKGVELLNAIKQEHGEEIYNQVYNSL